MPDELEAICRKEWGNPENVSVSLVDKTSETYTPPKPKFDFAKSQGQALGGAGAASSSAAASAQSFAGAVPKRLEVDASQPTTTLQLVMGGKRVKETANQSATVMQLYQHFMRSEPSSSARTDREWTRAEIALTPCLRSCSCDSPRVSRCSLSGLSGFELVAGFPPKPLTDPNLTLKDAGLLNGSITQRGG